MNGAERNADDSMASENIVFRVINRPQVNNIIQISCLEYNEPLTNSTSIQQISRSVPCKGLKKSTLKFFLRCFNSLER